MDSEMGIGMMEPWYDGKAAKLSVCTFCRNPQAGQTAWIWEIYSGEGRDITAELVLRIIESYAIIRSVLGSISSESGRSSDRSGKNLKGRECGKGIYQRKDGKYSARYCARNGSRQEKYFETLPEARNWLADAKYEGRHGIVVTTSEMTVDEWFDYWMGNLICDIPPNTRRTYEKRYKAIGVLVPRKPKKAIERSHWLTVHARFWRIVTMNAIYGKSRIRCRKV